MKPTPEQLRAVAMVIASAPEYDGDDRLISAQAAWDVIAPMVLEEAAKVADDVAAVCAMDSSGPDGDATLSVKDAAGRIRALK